MSKSKKKGGANKKSRKLSKKAKGAVSQNMKKRVWKHQGR